MKLSFSILSLKEYALVKAPKSRCSRFRVFNQKMSTKIRKQTNSIKISSPSMFNTLAKISGHYKKKLKKKIQGKTRFLRNMVLAYKSSRIKFQQDSGQKLLFWHSTLVQLQQWAPCSVLWWCIMLIECSSLMLVTPSV